MSMLMLFLKFLDKRFGNMLQCI